jgi:hypothetical protein
MSRVFLFTLLVPPRIYTGNIIGLYTTQIGWLSARCLQITFRWMDKWSEIRRSCPEIDRNLEAGEDLTVAWRLASTAGKAGALTRELNERGRTGRQGTYIGGARRSRAVMAARKRAGPITRRRGGSEAAKERAELRRIEGASRRVAASGSKLRLAGMRVRQIAAGPPNRKFPHLQTAEDSLSIRSFFQIKLLPAARKSENQIYVCVTT